MMRVWDPIIFEVCIHYFITASYRILMEIIELFIVCEIFNDQIVIKMCLQNRLFVIILIFLCCICVVFTSETTTQGAFSHFCNDYR